MNELRGSKKRTLTSYQWNLTPISEKSLGKAWFIAAALAAQVRFAFAPAYMSWARYAFSSVVHGGIVAFVRFVRRRASNKRGNLVYEVRFCVLRDYLFWSGERESLYWPPQNWEIYSSRKMCLTVKVRESGSMNSQAVSRSIVTPVSCWDEGFLWLLCWIN